MRNRKSKKEIKVQRESREGEQGRTGQGNRLGPHGAYITVNILLDNPQISVPHSLRSNQPYPSPLSQE